MFTLTVNYGSHSLALGWLCQNHPGIKAKPTAIYLGCKMEQNNRNELYNFAKENNIQIYQMHMDFSQKEYVFDYKKL